MPDLRFDFPNGTGAQWSEVSEFHLTGGLLWYPRRSLVDIWSYLFVSDFYINIYI